MKLLHLSICAVLLVASAGAAALRLTPSVRAQASSAQVSQAGQSAQAGQSGDSEAQSDDVISVTVEEVTVPFIVTDGRNRMVTDLAKEDFQVKESNVAQTIFGFVRETDVPLRLGILIDTSASIRDRLVFEQQAAAEFLRNNLRVGKDKALLGSFDSSAELLADFTDDLDTLVKAIDQVRAGGGTALYEAIYYASKDRLLAEAPLSSSFRRALIVLSDGEDNQSRFSRAQTLEAARRAEVTVYTISTNVRGAPMPGDKVLQEFAEESGGRFFRPATWDDLDDAFEAIATELRSQYTLSYRPSTPRDGKYHDIDIQLLKRKGLRVRARRGYYATRGGAAPAASNGASSLVPPARP